MINWNPLKQLSMVHHEDVSHALLLAASTPGVGGRIYNVADDNPTFTIGDLIKLYEGPERVPTKDGWLMSNLWELTADTERIKKELNFHPKYPSIYTAKDREPCSLN